MSPETLCQDSIFVGESTQTDVSLAQFYTSLQQDNLVSLLPQTYSLLKSSTSIDESLKVWEIRLLLLIFAGQLQQAKQEAISLNNVMYLSENNNVPPPNAATIQSSSPNSSTMLTRLYPLCKNNNGMLNHRFLLLLLRLKSVPNLALINEFYKLCYQLRLKSHTFETDNLSTNLTNLTFDIMVILIINKNYVTLLSFLQSLDSELESDAQPQISKIKLLIIITKIISFTQCQTPRDSIKKTIAEKHQQEFDSIINSDAGSSFLYIVNTISPYYTPDLPKEEELLHVLNAKTLGLPELVDWVSEGKVTGRILCSLLGVWDLMNHFKFEIDSETGQLKHQRLRDTEDPSLDDCYDVVNSRWCDNVNRVYGLE